MLMLSMASTIDWVGGILDVCEDWLERGITLDACGGWLELLAMGRDGGGGAGRLWLD